MCDISLPSILFVYSVTKQFTAKTNAWSKQTVSNGIKFVLPSDTPLDPLKA